MIPQHNLDAIRKESIRVTGDDLAKQELETKYSRNNRNEEVQKAFHRIFRWFIYAVSIVGIAVICIRMVHLVLPENKAWLSEEQIQAIDKLFFSGAIGGFIANYIRKVNEKA